MSVNTITVKDGVLFKVIAPGGFYILSAIQRTADNLSVDLVITSACDGEHSGPNDPHHLGNAYDIRTRNLEPEVKHKVLDSIMTLLGWIYFYGFVESPGTDNEHIHVQVKKGITFP